MIGFISIYQTLCSVTAGLLLYLNSWAIPARDFTQHPKIRVAEESNLHIVFDDKGACSL
jgi:hypothetical protein